jgi:DNA-binding CsgD family transcriptional regulator
VPRKNKGGRPPFVPTEKDSQIVLIMVGANIGQDKIAMALGISEATLRKHFKTEIRKGAAQVEAQLVANMMRLAGGKDGTAFRANEFMLNCRFGWSRYAPPPVPRLADPVDEGKKAALERRAIDGHKETSWGDVVH